VEYLTVKFFEQHYSMTKALFCWWYFI